MAAAKSTSTPPAQIPEESLQGMVIYWWFNGDLTNQNGDLMVISWKFDGIH